MPMTLTNKESQIVILHPCGVFLGTAPLNGAGRSKCCLKVKMKRVGIETQAGGLEHRQ